MNARVPAAALLALAVFAAGSPAWAVDQQSNHTAAFLRGGVDPRHLALGSVGAALADDIAAGYWNPAGLAWLRGFSATAMSSQALDFDRSQNYVAAAWGAEHAAFAISWINAGVADIPGADAGGNPTESFQFAENAVILSAATAAGSANVGVSAKFIAQDLGTSAPYGGEDQATGYAFDVGAQYSVTEFARVGLAFQDLFGRLGAEDRDRVNQIPATGRFGLALEPVDGFTLGVDLVKIRDDDNVRFRVGGEIAVPFGNSMDGAVRLGLNEGKMSGGIGITAGVFSIDYAYVVEPEAFLDENHRFSLSVDLGSRRQVVRESAGMTGDRDRDGFPDAQDGCPDVSEDFDSFQDFDGCPDLDNDEDGIEDAEDLCPDEPETLNGIDDDDGCPDADRDHDGITDDRDGCPDQAETINGVEDEDGCPDTVSVVFPPARIPFATGMSALPPGPQPSLDEVARILVEQPTLRIEIQGHTDNAGDDLVNMRLSLERAEAVKAYLVSRGIASDRLVARGYGETRPTAGNGTAGGRTANRRIEFVPLPS